MRKARWLAEWRNSENKPVFYHCISRVVDRRFAFGSEEKEKFRTLMRIYEKFSGCRVTAYCLMDNHFHILLEVPPMAENGLSDRELLKRLSAIYNEAFVAVVAKELADARERKLDSRVVEIHERFSYRMHSLAEFMKGLLQRYTQWHNRVHSRTGRLWENRFKSVIVEDGEASKTIAAYIDLNPVRAGIVDDPSEYRWSSYGEAMGGGALGNGRKARAGLVRALMAHKGYSADARHWAGRVSREYRMLLLVEGEEQLKEVVNSDGEHVLKVAKKGMKREVTHDELDQLQRGRNVAVSRMLRCRVRYFTDGAVIGSREFVDKAFKKSRERFGAKRKNGARKMRGAGAAAAGVLWSLRDLKLGVE